MRTILSLIMVTVGLSVTGCATTRVVKTQPGKGGEIAVHDGLFGDAHADAKKKMASNCGSKHAEVLEEGEQVVGQNVHANTDKTKYGSTTNGSSEDKREWRIKYKCTKKGKTADAE